MVSNRGDDEVDPAPSADLQALEARLAALRPREDRLSRERLMFLAGQASVGQRGLAHFAKSPEQNAPVTLSGRRRPWAWPAAFSGMTAAAAALLVVVVQQGSELAS